MRSAASVLASNVTLRLESVDRVFLAGYVPQLQTEGQVVRFLLNRGYRIPSPVGLGHNHDRLIADIETFAASQGLEIVRFAKHDRKEEVARPLLAGAERMGTEGVVLIGKAQERVAGWRGFKDNDDPRTSSGHPHFSYRRQSLFVDHFYFYLWDRDWGPAFFKLCPYAPYPMWVWCNGHEWAKQQLARAGIGYTALDNGFRDVDDPAAAHRICARLSAGHLRHFLRSLGRSDARARSPPRMLWSAAATTGRCASSSCPTPPCSTGRRLAGPGSKPPSATTSISVDPIGLRSSSTADPPPRQTSRPRVASPLRSSPPTSIRRSRSATGPPKPRPTSRSVERCVSRPLSMTLQSAQVRAKVCKVAPEVHKFVSRTSWTRSAVWGSMPAGAMPMASQTSLGSRLATRSTRRVARRGRDVIPDGASTRHRYWSDAGIVRVRVMCVTITCGLCVASRWR